MCEIASLDENFITKLLTIFMFEPFLNHYIYKSFDYTENEWSALTTLDIYLKSGTYVIKNDF